MVINDFDTDVICRDTTDNSWHRWCICNIDNHHLICIKIELVETGPFHNQNTGHITPYEDFKKWLLANPDTLVKV